MSTHQTARPLPGLRPRPALSAVKSTKAGSIAPIPDIPIVMLVTPEIAQDWLENRNLHNRRKSNVTARKYSKTIRGERWKCTHEGIAFDRDGFLIDGQHRLMAIVETGITVKMFVIPFVEGMDEDTFGVLNSGNRRQAAQMLHFPGSAAAAAAAKILGVVDDSFSDGTHVTGGVVATNAENDEVLDVVDDWPELRSLTTSTSAAYKTSRIPQSIHLAMLAQASRTRYAPRMQSWIEGLSTGIGLGEEDARRFVMRRFVGAERQFSDASGRAVGYRLLVKAWNCHATDKPMKKLQASLNEAVPEVVK
jgi:hypothetical protein